MRIAQVAPLFESVPPKGYGGTERVVSYLVEELVKQGHDVTLFASADSETKAHLVSPWSRSLRLDPRCIDLLAHHVVMLQEVYREKQNFDVIHFHIDYLHYPLSALHRVTHLTIPGCHCTPEQWKDREVRCSPRGTFGEHDASSVFGESR
jgi:glycosyltransferase involved in cell wall biosynthesis